MARPDPSLRQDDIAALGLPLRTYGAAGLGGVLSARPIVWFLLAVEALLAVAGISEAHGTELVRNAVGGAGMIGATLLLAWAGLGRSRDVITVHERGLRWVHRGRVRLVAWTEIIGLGVA